MSEYSQVILNRRVLAGLLLVVDDYRAPITISNPADYSKRDCECLVNYTTGGKAGEFFQNASGLYCVTGLADDTYDIEISAARFITNKTQLVVAGVPVSPTTIRLQPGYDYNFPANVTYLRGRLVDSVSGAPVTEASIVDNARPASAAVSDEKGRFVIYYQPGVIAAAGETLTLNISHTLYSGTSHVESGFTDQNRVTLTADISMVKI